MLSAECAAHPLYKQRVLGAERTLETVLFGFGWYARHRVVPNASTARWCSKRTAGPRAVALVNRLSQPLGRRMPLSAPAALLQLRGLPLYSPAPALVGMPDRVVDVTPLYAGECARQIHEILPAREALAELARGLSS